jgi:hypothetical protein
MSIQVRLKDPDTAGTFGLWAVCFVTSVHKATGYFSAPSYYPGELIVSVSFAFSQPSKKRSNPSAKCPIRLVVKLACLQNS